VVERPTIHVVCKAELAADAWSARWDDPDRLAELTPEKRAALLSNPLSTSDDDPMQLVGTIGERVVGRWDLIVGRFEAGGEPIPCHWGSGLAVPAEYRRTLLGVQLILKQRSLAHTAGVCGVSQLAHPIFAGLKWHDFAMPRHIALRRSRSVVERYLGSGPAGRVGRAAADAGLLGQRTYLGALRRLRAVGLRCEQVDRMGSELDEALARPDRPVAAHRSSAWVNWLVGNSFHAEPQSRRGLFYIRDEDERVVAYFLAKCRLYEAASHHGFRNVLLGSLQDWLVLDSSRVDLERILLFAVERLSAWNVDAIEVCLPEDEAATPLARLGFARVGELHVLVGASSKSPLAAPAYREAGAWRLRPAEGDNFFS
jgi:hypothetical protein